MDMFDVIFDRVLGHEGGFQADPRDRGNWTGGEVGKGELKGTKYGLAAMTYHELDIPALTLAEAKAIYRRDWWDGLKMSQWPKAWSKANTRCCSSPSHWKNLQWPCSGNGPAPAHSPVATRGWPKKPRTCIAGPWSGCFTAR